MTIRQRASLAVVMAVCALGVSGVALKFLSIPFWWIGLTWAAAGFALAAFAPRAMQLPVSIVGSVFLALAFGELYFAYTGRPAIDRTFTPAQFNVDSLLGWKLQPSQVIRATSKIGREIIYDVRYTTDALGRRIAPLDSGDQSRGCLLFFVDSFVFGDGVNDHEALPYQVGLKTQGRYRVVNFAANGYGAEHLLAIVQRGELATNQPCVPTHILYAALPHHIHRAAGKEWSQRGPRYQLGPKGNLEYLGTKFDAGKAKSGSDIESPLKKRLSEQLWKSTIYRAWMTRPAPTTESEIELYFAIVREAYRLFKHRWPDAELHVISWDIHDFYANGQARFHRGVETVGAVVHFIDDILPGYTEHPSKFGLHRFDLHPNPMAHEMVAAYLVDRLGLSTQDPSASAAIGKYP